MTQGVHVISTEENGMWRLVGLSSIKKRNV